MTNLKNLPANITNSFTPTLLSEINNYNIIDIDIIMSSNSNSIDSVHSDNIDFIDDVEALKNCKIMDARLLDANEYEELLLSNSCVGIDEIYSEPEDRTLCILVSNA